MSASEAQVLEQERGNRGSEAGAPLRERNVI